MAYAWQDNTVFFEYKGVIVRHIYKSDFAHNLTRDCWFTLNPGGSDNHDHGEEGTFDYRNLTTACDEDTAEARIKAAIDSGELRKLVGAEWWPDDGPEDEGVREEPEVDRFLNKYRCPRCKIAWHARAPSTHNDRCPKCDWEIEPYESEDLIFSFIVQARTEYQNDEVKIYDDAKVDDSPDDGVWVEAWLWVAKEL